MRRAREVLVFVPSEVAWAFTADRGWHVIASPPAWWLEQQAEVLDEEAGGPPRTGGRRAVAARLQLVPALQQPRTACRPGPGPCMRRHEHTSRRRAPMAS